MQMANKLKAAACLMALALTNLVLKPTSGTQPSTDPAAKASLGAGSLIGQTKILVFQDLGSRGEFWATSEEWLDVPPPGSKPVAFSDAARQRRVRWVYWIFRPGDQAPTAIFGAESSGFAEDGPVGSGTPSDQLLDAALPREDELIEVEREGDGTYRVHLWKDYGASGWRLLGSDSDILLEGEKGKPLR